MLLHLIMQIVFLPQDYVAFYSLKSLRELLAFCAVSYVLKCKLVLFFL